MHKRTALHGLAAATLTLGLGLVGPQAFAADPIKIGLILPKAKTVNTLEAAEVFLKEIGLPAWDNGVKMLVKHFQNLAPMRVEEEGEIYETIEKTGDDHLVHATGYAKLGLDKLEGGVSAFSFEF